MLFKNLNFSSLHTTLLFFLLDSLILSKFSGKKILLILRKLKIKTRL